MSNKSHTKRNFKHLKTLLILSTTLSLNTHAHMHQSLEDKREFELANATYQDNLAYALKRISQVAPIGNSSGTMPSSKYSNKPISSVFEDTTTHETADLAFEIADITNHETAGLTFEAVSNMRDYANDAYKLFYPDHQPTRFLDNEEIVFGLSNLQTPTPVAIAGYDPDLGIVVSFAGTSTRDQILTDLRANTIAHDILPGTIHHGFSLYHQGYENNLTQILSKLTFEHPEANIYFTGHSLGGAQAYLAGTYYKHNEPESNVYIITFSAPLVGDYEFNTYSNELLGAHNIINFACSDDVVTFGKAPGSELEAFGTKISYALADKQNHAAENSSLGIFARGAAGFVSRHLGISNAADHSAFKTALTGAYSLYDATTGKFRKPTLSAEAAFAAAGELAHHSHEIPSVEYLKKLYEDHVSIAQAE